jgi:hypothetical protein
VRWHAAACSGRAASRPGCAIERGYEVRLPRSPRVLGDVYCSHMKRTQIYIRDDQAERILERAEERGISQAEVIRQILDAALDTGDAEAEARAAILATAGVLQDAPDWPEWQRSVRGRSAAERLDELES